LFTPNSNAGLFRVSAAGGGVAEATTLDSENDEHSHRWPDILPGGKAVLYTTRSRREDETIYRNIDVVSLETGERKALIEG
jgi:serine/threonine-protein kinase